MTGTLYLCATPIGNLEDITFRVLRTLKEVDLIAAEDTRNSIKLLNHFEIKTKMTSYHEYNKIDKAVYLVERLKEGPKRYAGIYGELAEILGDAAVNKIWKQFSGTNVTFPQRLYSKEYTREFIKDNWGDMSASEIARTVGLSERRVRQIASDIKKKS